MQFTNNDNEGDIGNVDKFVGTWSGLHFFDIALPQFQYLRNEFGYRKPAKISRSLYHTLTYRGVRTAVHINFDIRDQYILVDLIRLVDGKIPPLFQMVNGEVIADTQNYFSLRKLLLLHNPDAVKDIDISDYGLITEKMTRLLVNEATLLKKYGTRVLNGDFSEFDVTSNAT